MEDIFSGTARGREKQMYRQVNWGVMDHGERVVYRSGRHPLGVVQGR